MKTNCAGSERKVKLYVSISVLLSVCSGLLSIVFAYTVRIIIDYATNDLTYSLMQTVVKIVSLLLLMAVTDLIRNVTIAKTLFHVNTNLKSASLGRFLILTNIPMTLILFQF